MGTDITIYLERKSLDGNWEKYEKIPEEILPNGRDYRLFSFLFGIRGEYSEALFAYRGWPIDHSWGKCKTCEHGGYFGYSYLTYEESQSIKWPDDLADNYFKIFCDYVWPLCRICVKSFAYLEMRMLVSFDC